MALAILLPVATLTLKIPMLDTALPQVNVDLFKARLAHPKTWSNLLVNSLRA